MPIAHEVFPGATADVRSFARVVTSLRERFPVGRVIVVSDRGTVSEENLELLSSLGLSYIVGMRMRRVREVGEEMVGKLVEKLCRGGLKGLVGNRGGEGGDR